MFGKLMPYIAAGLAVIAIGFGVALGVQNARLDTARANLRAAEFGTSVCVESNKANVEAVAKLHAINQANDELIAMSRVAVATLAVSVQDWRETALATAAREEQLRRSLYADDPECARWGADPVCPGIADRLRRVQAAGRPH